MSTTKLLKRELLAQLAVANTEIADLRAQISVLTCELEIALRDEPRVVAPSSPAAVTKALSAKYKACARCHNGTFQVLSKNRGWRDVPSTLLAELEV